MTDDLHGDDLYDRQVDNANALRRNQVYSLGNLRILVRDCLDALSRPVTLSGMLTQGRITVLIWYMLYVMTLCTDSALHIEILRNLGSVIHVNSSKHDVMSEAS